MTALGVILALAVVLVGALALVYVGYRMRGAELAATDPKAPGGHDVSVGPATVEDWIKAYDGLDVHAPVRMQDIREGDPRHYTVGFDGGRDGTVVVAWRTDDGLLHILGGWTPEPPRRRRIDLPLPGWLTRHARRRRP